MTAGPAGTKILRTLHMENIKYEGYNWLQIQRQRRNALLYVAARFMMVRIDVCAKRKRARAQAQAIKRR